MKKHNFYAGPSILPQYTIDKSIEGIKDFAGTGYLFLKYHTGARNLLHV